MEDNPIKIMIPNKAGGIRLNIFMFLKRKCALVHQRRRFVYALLRFFCFIWLSLNVDMLVLPTGSTEGNAALRH